MLICNNKNFLNYLSKFSFLIKRRIFFIIGMFYWAILPDGLNSQIANYQPDELLQIDVEEHLGDKIPLDLYFMSDAGDTLQLSQFFEDGKPAILVMAYYRCPMLCSMVLNGMTDAAQQIPFELGTDYKILTISIDPTETPKLASEKKANYVASWGDSTAADNWTFFVGNQNDINLLTNVLGFKYYYVEEKNEYAHPAVLHILTADGTISRYLYGIQFKPHDLRLSLLEAAQGKIGNTIDKILLYCYHYDPNSKGYAVFAGNVMRLGGLATLLLLGTFLLILWQKYRVRNV